MCVGDLLRSSHSLFPTPGGRRQFAPLYTLAVASQETLLAVREWKTALCSRASPLFEAPACLVSARAYPATTLLHDAVVCKEATTPVHSCLYWLSRNVFDEFDTKEGQFSLPFASQSARAAAPPSREPRA